MKEGHVKLNRIVAFACGMAIWVLSPAVTGRVEPWDAKGPYYWLALFGAGFAAGLMEPAEVRTAPLWVVAGQSTAILAGVFFAGRDIGLFVPMGLVLLFIFSALCYAGAFLGATIRKLGDRGG